MYFPKFFVQERTSLIESLCHSPQLRRLRWVTVRSGSALLCSDLRSDAGGGGKSSHHFCSALSVSSLFLTCLKSIYVCAALFLLSLEVGVLSLGSASALRHRLKGRVPWFSTTADGQRYVKRRRQHGFLSRPGNCRGREFPLSVTDGQVHTSNQHGSPVPVRSVCALAFARPGSK